MKKTFRILNTEFIINADKLILDFVEANIPFYMQSDILNSHIITYIEEKNEYDLIKKSLNNGNVIRFYGEEYKTRYIVENKIILLDNNLIIINENGNFLFIANNTIARRSLIYFIREAIYENYILHQNLVFHSAGFELNNKGYALLGQSGAGKTTLLLEMISKFNANLITNDLLAINDYNQMIASILPLRIANGTLNRFNGNIYSNSFDKQKYEINTFLKKFNCDLKNEINLYKILLPNFSLSNEINIVNVNSYDAFEIIKKQTMNIVDPVRPYMWINEFSKEEILKEFDIDSKIMELLINHEIIKIEYGEKLEEKDKEKIMRALK